MPPPPRPMLVAALLAVATLTQGCVSSPAALEQAKVAGQLKSLTARIDSSERDFVAKIAFKLASEQSGAAFFGDEPLRTEFDPVASELLTRGPSPGSDFVEVSVQFEALEDLEGGIQLRLADGSVLPRYSQIILEGLSSGALMELSDEGPALRAGQILESDFVVELPRSELDTATIEVYGAPYPLPVLLR